MDRLACVDVPALAERAEKAADIRRIDPERAAEILADIDADTHHLTERLRRWSPDVDPHAHRTGTFWLSAAGMDKLFPDREKWAHAIQQSMAEAGFLATVIVGFNRFCTAALAHQAAGVIRVLTDPETERRVAARVPLSQAPIDPKVRDFLAKLGIKTLGQLAKLPPGGLLTRFGKDAHAIQELCAGRAYSPIRPLPPPRKYRASLDFDDPEENSDRLVFAAKTLIAPLLTELAHDGARCAELRLDIAQDRAEPRTDVLRPAEPTLDDRALLRLLHLRLEATPLKAGARSIDVELVATPADARQLSLIARAPRRDRGAQRRAFARLRAEFGNASVARAHLRDAHLPEAQHTWQPLHDLPRQATHTTSRPALIRRMYARPQLLAKTGDDIGPGDWLSQNLGRAVQVFGPYVVCGGWWKNTVDRAYYFIRAERGDMLWVYRDRRRRQWLIHGRVE